MEIRELECRYCSAISDYLGGNPNPELQYCLALSNGKPRYWNCVDLIRAKEHILWTSINPSGSPNAPQGNVPFNLMWDNLDESQTYWKLLKQKVAPVIDICGHMDLLPIHIGLENKLHKLLFSKDNLKERNLAVNLLRTSQEMIEDLRPKLIIHSNSTSRFLWGTEINKGIFWLGYILEEVSGFVPDCWKEGKGCRKLYQIKGLHPDSIKTIKSTNLLGTFLLIDYQVGTRTASKSIGAKDVKNLWQWVLKNQE